LLVHQTKNWMGGKALIAVNVMIRVDVGSIDI
jgi:hypothetical protein